ncbi:MAG: PDZ domain-containing protein [Hyphomonadaceae bacterium]|nr:PDZ domain-containing protein [Hyphomonadaceae bacterium]
MKVLRLLVMLWSLALAACATAPAPGPVHQPAVVAFERGGQGHIIIPVVVQGEDGFAILDNGASTSVIDRDFATEKDLVHGAFARTFIKTVTSGYELGQDAVLNVGGIEETVTPLLLDMAPMSIAAGKPVLAIVGEEFFERHVVEVDFTKKTMTLHDRRTFVAPTDLPAIPLKSARTAKTRIPAMIEDEADHEVTFDLGSSSLAMIDEGKISERWLAEGRPWTMSSSGIVQRGAMQRSDGHMMTAREITFAGFRLGDIPVEVMPKGFVSPADVSIGVNALSHFDLIFDVGGKRMWMRPNASYGAEFRHRLIGVAWRTPVKPGALEVNSVQTNSPAEKAGLKRGDVIVRVNGAEAVEGAFVALKEGETADLELKDGTMRKLTAGRYY